MDDIKAIDIMNYPLQCKVMEYDFNKFQEWRQMAETTFKPMFPSGRFPVTTEEYQAHKFLYGTVFYPYESVARLIQAMDEEGYDKICITACKLWSYRRSHSMIFDFTIDQVNDMVKAAGGRLIGAAGYDPFRIQESLRDIEKAVKEYGFKFVYAHPITFGLPFNDKKMYPLYGLCNSLGVPVSMQAGHSAEPLPSWVGNPMTVDEVVIDFPDLKINLSHTGFPWIKEWIDLIWKHPNVYGDISAYMPRGLDPEYLSFISSSRGRGKVMWGTNGLGLKRGKQEIMGMEWKDEAKKLVLRDNALRFLGIEG
ncbi:MAG: amidohydrolase family protein [Desulfobacterales bacterium]|nr:amidohydrolase family protein [Desulfobacterales bacterium]